MQKILAFSSSRVANGAYLEKAVPVIDDFLGSKSLLIAFVPFASVDNYEDYTTKVREGLQTLLHNIQTVTPANAQKVLGGADVIMIGGGNTFKLLHDLYELEVVELIKTKVQSGIPYIGWSAGSNLTGPTICTTNDMPVIEPKSFSAFGFFPFQINPHYHNIVMEGFHGETRDQRLEEFLKLNPLKHIVCLPEGTALQAKEGKCLYTGEVNGLLMYGKSGMVLRKEMLPGTIIEELLSSISQGM
jgi:dipeptidase E